MKISFNILFFQYILLHHFVNASKQDAISVKFYNIFPFVYLDEREQMIKGIEFQLLKLITNKLNEKFDYNLFDSIDRNFDFQKQRQRYVKIIV